MAVKRVVSKGVRRVADVGVLRAGAIWHRQVLVFRLRLNAWLRQSRVAVHISPDAKIEKGIVLDIAPHSSTTVRIGANTHLAERVRLRLHGGLLDLGEKIDVRGGATLSVSGGGELVLEGPNNLSWGVTVHCAESVYLEKFAHVAEYTTIVDSSHFYTDPDGWSYHNLRTAPIRLGQDVWVCPKATITSGVTIGDHTIIASNTVVVKDVPAGVLFSGVPGRVVRELDLPWKDT